MTAPIGGVPGKAVGGLDRQHATLKKAAQDLEAVFLNELFKAMREATPQDGILSQDSGQELFTGMLDERLAELHTERTKGGLGEALYRQLSRRLPTPPTQAAGDP